MHFINRSVSCWKWNRVILFSGSMNLCSQRDMKKREQLLNTCYVSGPNVRCLHRYFLSSSWRWALLCLCSCSCSDEACGCYWWALWTTSPRLLELGWLACFQAVPGFLPGSGHSASGGGAVSSVCLTRTDLTSAPNKAVSDHPVPSHLLYANLLSLHVVENWATCNLMFWL